MENKKRENIVVEAESSIDTKKTKVVDNESRIKKLESKLEDYMKEMNEKFIILKQHTQKYEFKFNHWIRSIQESITKKKYDNISLKSWLYESSIMSRNDIMVMLEVVMVIGSLYGFAQIVCLLLSKIIGLFI